MVRILLTVLATVVLIGHALGEDRPRSDMEKLQGTWVLTSYTHNGQTYAGEAVKSRREVYQIVGNRIRSYRMGQLRLESTFKIDPTRDPKAIDELGDSKDPSDRVAGIYSVTEERLVLCHGPANDPRPGRFSAVEGSNRFVLVLERDESEVDRDKDKKR